MQYEKNDPILANPKIQSLIAAAYCELRAEYREAARDHFKAAEAVGFHDVKMMRKWFHLELMSGYGLTEAERICRVMIGDVNVSGRYKSEFYSKLGNCYTLAAASAANVDREKTIFNLKNATDAYLASR